MLKFDVSRSDAEGREPSKEQKETQPTFFVVLVGKTAAPLAQRQSRQFSYSECTDQTRSNV